MRDSNSGRLSSVSRDRPVASGVETMEEPIGPRFTAKTESGVVLEELPRELGDLLSEAESPLSMTDWNRRACDLGAESDEEAQELLSDLQRDGLLQGSRS